MSAICECICGCQVVADNPDATPYLCSVCSLREMRGDGEFHHLKRNPLPPTAEQTSIARFNALANEIRELRQRTWSIAELKGYIDAGLVAKLDRMAETQQQNYENLLRLTAIQWDSLSKAIKPRAVAKNKAAPLVGKKGTGRKG